MTEYKPLTDEKSRFIAEKIYNKNASKTSSHETPTMILVAGQPGAGKTAAANNAKLELRQKGGFIHVDADKVRLEIPGGHTVPSSETQADCQKLVMHLRNFAIVGGRNILEEGTFRGERVFSETAEKMHEKGYNVEVIGVAAHMEQSRFNVQSRREKQREAGEPPRDVPEKYQEDAYRGYTANMVNDTGTLDRVRVVNRAGQMLFDSADRGNSLYGSVEEALEKGRTLSVEQLAKIRQDWTELQQKCEDKRLSPQDMARIHEGRALFEECFKRETDKQQVRYAPRHDMDRNQAVIHIIAKARIPENIEALKQNPALADRMPKDLGSLAYARGICQEMTKDKPQAVQDEALAKFDKDAESPSYLAKLENRQASQETAQAQTSRKQERDDDHGMER